MMRFREQTLTNSTQQRYDHGHGDRLMMASIEKKVIDKLRGLPEDQRAEVLKFVEDLAGLEMKVDNGPASAVLIAPNCSIALANSRLDLNDHHQPAAPLLLYVVVCRVMRNMTMKQPLSGKAGLPNHIVALARPDVYRIGHVTCTVG